MSYRVPVLRPMWLSPYLSQLQVTSPAAYKGSMNMNWMAQAGKAAFDIPLLALEHAWSTSFHAVATLTSAGAFYVLGSGSRTDTFVTATQVIACKHCHLIVC